MPLNCRQGDRGKREMEREEGYETANGEWEGRMQDLKKSRWEN
jgi:hypothetical protein